MYQNRACRLSTITLLPLYIDFVSQINPRKVKFFDESGFKTVAHRFYGHSKYNERAIELGKFIPNANITLNLFVSLDGPAYFNFVDGPSNAQAFLNFWAEKLRQVVFHRLNLATL